MKNNFQTHNIQKDNEVKKYTPEEINKLKKFIKVIKDEESRVQLVCWGNSYSHGY